MTFNVEKDNSSVDSATYAFEKEEQMGKEKLEANTKHTEDDVGYLSPELLVPEDLLNSYVIVRYERQVYPGVVLDSDEAEV